MMPDTLTLIGGGARAVPMRKKSLAALFVAASLGGCVQVEAPDKPIVINLNVNVRQEVVFRLTEDVRKLIEQNPGVF